ncbi:MAG TPA: hypothetical protein VFA69_07305 [Candidatus Nitrosotalea sp.]|nr:hypothetical protein [Candidatus Nitrosotalea sp.]
MCKVQASHITDLKGICEVAISNLNGIEMVLVEIEITMVGYQVEAFSIFLPSN